MPLPPVMQTFLSQPRDVLIEPLCTLLQGYVHPDGDTPAQVHKRLAAVLRATSDEDWADYLAYLATLGADWGRNDAHAVGRKMTDALLQPLLDEESRLEGVQHLDAALATGRRVLLVGNHLSYVDPTAVWALLGREGRQDLGDRLTAVAGPKVYEGEPMRLMGASANHTIKVAQSSEVTDSNLSPREMVRLARASMRLASDLMEQGRVVLIYPEGTRSRTGALGPFLKAVGRWLTMDGVLLVPLGLTGTDRIYTLEDDRLRRTTVRARFGPKLDPMEYGRNGVVAAAREAVRALLPEEMKGAETA